MDMEGRWKGNQKETERDRKEHGKGMERTWTAQGKTDTTPFEGCHEWTEAATFLTALSFPDRIPQGIPAILDKHIGEFYLVQDHYP